jgi:L-alanine-DL-glutamate epimerase-like enolase superfamily enzyme
LISKRWVMLTSSCLKMHWIVDVPQDACSPKVASFVGDLDIAVDCHWRLNLNDARKLAARLEEFRLMWMEDPLPPWSTEEFKQLTRATLTRVGSGEKSVRRKDCETRS